MGSVPSEPIIEVRPVCKPGEITFTWQPPVNPGASSVLKYTLYCDAISYSHDIVGAEQYTYTVSGLTDGVDHTFYMTATNSQGEGPSATFRTVQPGLRPAGPPTATLSTINDSTGLITWDNNTPVSGEAATKWYRIRAQPSSMAISSFSLTANAYDRQAIAYNLTTGQAYRFLVQAVNDVGYCEPTAFTDYVQFGYAFSPSSITGLAAWLDMTDYATLTLSGSDITAVADKSGNSRTATPLSTSPTYNASGLNSRPCAEIDVGKTLRLSAASGTFSSGGSVFVVFKKTGATQDYEALVTRTTGNMASPFDIYTNTTAGPDNFRFVGDGSADNYVTSDFNLSAATTPTVFDYTFTGSAWEEYVNGTAATITGSLSGTYGDNGSYIDIGTRDDTVTSFIGNIGEVLVYNSWLSTSDRQKVEGYLAWKWGLQGNLPVGHPYKDAPPAGSPPPPTFSPSDLTGLTTWLDGADAATVTQSGGTVTVWADKSGNGHDATHAAGSGPTYSSNGLNFTGQNMPTNTPFTTQITVIMVATQQSGGASYYIRRNGAPADSPSFIVNYDGSKLEYFNGADRDLFSATPASIFSAAFSYDSGNQVKGWYNGTNVFTISQTQSGNSEGSFPIILGAPGFDLNARFQEFIVYNRVLTDGEMGQVMTYLASKWSIV